MTRFSSNNAITNKVCNLKTIMLNLKRNKFITKNVL